MHFSNGASAFIPFVSLLVQLENDSTISYVDPVHSIVCPLETAQAPNDTSDLARAIRSTIFGDLLFYDTVVQVSKEHLPLVPHKAGSNLFWSDTILCEQRPLDHVQINKLNALLTLTKFELLAKYGKDARLRALAACSASWQQLAESKSRLLIVCSKLWSTVEEPVLGISYMPPSEAGEAWLQEQLDVSSPSHWNRQGTTAAFAVDLTSTIAGQKLAQVHCGLLLKTNTSHEVLAQSLEYLLLAQLFNAFSDSIDGNEAHSMGALIPLVIFPTSCQDNGIAAQKLFSIAVLSDRHIGFTRKLLVYEMEQQLLVAAESSSSSSSSSSSDVIDWRRKYSLLSSFLVAMDTDLYTIVMSRILRQMDPSISRDLLPVHLCAPHEVHLDAQNRNSECDLIRVTLLEVFQMALSRPLLQCSGQLLSLLCEALGGTESPAAINMCLVTCMEFILHALQFCFLDSTLQCLDFTERLLMILSSVSFLEESIGDSPHEIKRSVTSHLMSLKARHFNHSSRDESSQGKDNSGVISGVWWILDQLGIVAGDDLHGTNGQRGYSTDRDPHSLDDEMVVKMSYSGVDSVWMELGSDDFSRLLAGSKSQKSEQTLPVRQRTALLFGGLLAGRIRKLMCCGIKESNSHGDGTDQVSHSKLETEKQLHGHIQSITESSLSIAVDNMAVGSSSRPCNALVLVATLFQNAKARDLLRVYLELRLPPLLSHQFSWSPGKTANRFDYSMFCLQRYSGVLSAVSAFDLLPELMPDLPLLHPYWHILRIFKSLKKPNMSMSTPSHRLCPEMLRQDISIQYLLKLAQLEWFTQHSSECRGGAHGEAAPMYLGVFSDDIMRSSLTVSMVLRAVVVQFLIINDLHAALSALYAVRDILEDDVHEKIVSVAAMIGKLHRIRKKILILEDKAEVADDRTSPSPGEQEEDEQGAVDLEHLAEDVRTALSRKFEDVHSNCVRAIQDLVINFVLADDVS